MKKKEYEKVVKYSNKVSIDFILKEKHPSSLEVTSAKNNINPSRPNPGRRGKINFYFDTSLWCLKRFYEGLKGHFLSVLD